MDLLGDNIYLERKFRLELLDWLTNGKPKLFRSPTEGNYIVRLMNVSLTPNDTLGRMLYTFNCTAYEMAGRDLADPRSMKAAIFTAIDIFNRRAGHDELVANRMTIKMPDTEIKPRGGRIIE